MLVAISAVLPGQHAAMEWARFLEPIWFEAYVSYGVSGFDFYLAV